MIAVIDYGMGNLRSVQKALEKVGASAKITQDEKEIKNSKKIVLPGVGAIKPAIDKLESLGLVNIIESSIKAGKPFLGICLGFQLLFEKSDEGGDVKGLGIFEGTVDIFNFDKIDDKSFKVPHMGWNQLDILKADCPLYSGIDNLSYVYFCHSYFGNPKDEKMVSTKTDYGYPFASSVWKDNVFGVQFHPEKSQAIGLKILENFNNIK